MNENEPKVPGFSALAPLMKLNLVVLTYISEVLVTGVRGRE